MIETGYYYCDYYRTLLNTTLATRMAASQLGSMNVFNPDTDDWTAYVERLESFFVTNEIKDEKKVSVLVTFLGANAYELL